MYISSLTLKNFRNIQEQHLQFQQGLNVFRGANGQGKTNLVEAVHILTHGQSFRTRDHKVLIHQGDFQSCRISGELVCKNLKHQAEMRIQLGRKQFLLNGKKVSGNRLRQNFPSVLFSPESLQIIKESPQNRRRLLDDLCLGVCESFPQVYEDSARLLKQKNALLKQQRDGLVDSTEAHKLIHNITDLFFAKSSRMIALRLKTLKEILPHLKRAFVEIVGDSLVEIDVDYKISGQSAAGYDQEDIINALYKRWDQLKVQEGALGQALVGPHKHDIEFYFNGHEARNFCSQGQQRAIILAFKMAHIGLHWSAHGVYPILLLDDVLSELDLMKQKSFLRNLMATESQIFLTTTDAANLPKDLGESLYQVNLGRFSAGDRSVSGGLSV